MYNGSALQESKCPFAYVIAASSQQSGNIGILFFLVFFFLFTETNNSVLGPML
jgi:hypothetical protein